LTVATAATLRMTSGTKCSGATRSSKQLTRRLAGGWVGRLASQRAGSTASRAAYPTSPGL
jgi:hypothetical protein